MASDYNVQFRAVHINTLWRKAKHYDIENALRGKSGATELFAGKGRINYELHGNPQYVIAWENGCATGIAVKSDGNGGLLEHSVAIDFDDDVGVSADVLDKLFRSMSSTPNYWWVNHSQSYTVELEGGYIWAPKTKKDGAKNQAYTNLTLVRPGDIIVSYADTQIKAIGVAKEKFFESQKSDKYVRPGEAQGRVGWKVPISWTVLELPLRPKDHFEQIKVLLPNKHSPLQQETGNGNQSIYLASISKDLGFLIKSLAGDKSPVAVERIEELEDQVLTDLAVSQILEADIPETEKEQLVRSRRGQGVFRQRVLEVSSRCLLTGVSDQNFLIASHIKPWKDCTNKERLDGHNGLMLSPHVDRLFDRGWISFKADGEVLVSKSALPALKAWNIDPAKKVAGFSKQQEAYLIYHREFLFKD